MSRVGKKPILIPTGVDVTISGMDVRVKGPKGELEAIMHPNLVVALDEGEHGKEIQCSIKDETQKDAMAQWGTARANLASLVKGVTQGYSKQLEVNGVGYRANVSGGKLVLSLGFSHEVPVVLPKGIEAKVEGNVITVSGIDKHLVGELADRIRSLRPPEPYKGKGIRYTTETIRRKAGKTQKAGE